MRAFCLPDSKIYRLIEGHYSELASRHNAEHNEIKHLLI